MSDECNSELKSIIGKSSRVPNALIAHRSSLVASWSLIAHYFLVGG
jgi:hypothetical protein